MVRDFTRLLDKARLPSSLRSGLVEYMIAFL